MIFVGTGAWFAAFVPNDPDHQAANEWLDANREPLITTDYVIDELIRHRPGRAMTPLRDVSAV